MTALCFVQTFTSCIKVRATVPIEIKSVSELKASLMAANAKPKDEPNSSEAAAVPLEIHSVSDLKASLMLSDQAAADESLEIPEAVADTQPEVDRPDTEAKPEVGDAPVADTEAKPEGGDAPVASDEQISLMVSARSAAYRYWWLSTLCGVGGRCVC